MSERYKYTGVNSIKFNDCFRSDDDCYKYIASIKWDGEKFACKKCNHAKFCNGKSPYSRRCCKCRYDESATSGTMFDKCKFSILIAFHIVFKIGTKKKGMSTLELSKEFEQRQDTCWEFKWKIQQAMQSSKRFPMTGEIYIDECYFGGPEEDKPGRSKGNKRLVIIALQKLADGNLGRAYAKVIQNASGLEFKPFFNDYIDKTANVVTDKWAGYLPLIPEYPNLKQIPLKWWIEFSGYPYTHNEFKRMVKGHTPSL